MNYTEREREIARRLAEGEDVADIASALFLSPHTVKFHIRVLSMKIPGKGRPLVRIVRWHCEREAA